jgi:ribonuclease HI
MDKYMISTVDINNNINNINNINEKDTKSKNNYYVVKKGFVPGIYISWDDCKNQVNGYNGAIYKKFTNYEDAHNFLNNKTNIKTNNKINNQNQADVQKEIVKKNIIPRHNPDNNTYLSDYTYIFCDGSSIKKNHKSVRCGFGVCVIPIKIKKDPNLMSFFEIESYGKYLNPSGTNNFAELNAILFALNLILLKQKEQKDQKEENKNYCIVCDSSYALDSILIWSYTWKNNNWITSNNKPVENQDLIKEIIKKYELLISQDIVIKFKHMNSHQKKPANIDSYNYFLWFGNEIADKLAKDETYTIDIEEPNL